MKNFISLVIIMLIAISNVFGQQQIRVVDEESQSPIPGAHILDSNGEAISISDRDGIFTVDPKDYRVITITAVGFKNRSITLDSSVHRIALRPAIFHQTTELLVVGNDDRDNVRSYQNRKPLQSMDEFLENVDGVSMTRRGAFGWEPVIRGQSDQRMNLVIDGMQVFKACVDKMDPITSYVEMNNLSRLKIDKSGAGVAENGTGNSTVNLITQKAGSERLTMDLSSGVRLPDNYRTFRMSGNVADQTGKNSVRFSGSYKKADDFKAGNNQTVENTQYEKLNLNLNYRHTFTSNHSIELNYITDKAYDVGYPALLMDATKALADIGQVKFNFASSNKRFRFTSISLYANGVRHNMDDYERDVANRTVMRGMYMPMYGTTTTFGSKIAGSASVKTHSFDWFVDAFTSEAYGDMLMQSLDSSIEDMMIYNLDDVRTNNAGLGLRHRFNLSNSLLLKVEENLRFKSLNTGSETHQSFFEGLYDRDLSARQRILPSASANLLWMINDRWSTGGSVVYSERMGNHMELFGHYIYNYTDGYFYDGNPWLKTERSLNTELNVARETSHQSLSLTVFHKQYFNYIDGVLSEDVSNNDFRFKRYANVGDAVIMGLEFRSLHSLNNWFRLENRLSYLYAQNQTLDEPLPLIPPLKGISTVHFHTGTIRAMADIEWAAPQERIAQISSNEDETEGYAVVNVSVEKGWADDSVQTILQINNL
ncbi:MAG: TonB-dependent receptor, partial [Balneolaceae bacterium]|nr:TonB-dependent receptor [Balneolaceae bacterium]